MYQHRGKDQRQVGIAFKLFTGRECKEERHIVEHAVGHQIEQLVGLGFLADECKLGQQRKDCFDHARTGQRSYHGHNDACHRVYQPREQVFLFFCFFRLCIHRRLIFQPGHLDQVVIDLVHMRANDDLKLPCLVDTANHAIDLFYSLNIRLFRIDQMESQAGDAVRCGNDVFLSADRAQDLVDHFFVVRHKGNLLFLFRVPETDSEPAAMQADRYSIRQLCYSSFICQTGILQGDVQGIVPELAQAGIYFPANKRKKLGQKFLTIHRETSMCG